MVSPIDLINQAADQMGAQATCSGINPPIPANSLLAQVASRTYQTQVDSIFRAAHWGSARKQAPLALLKAAMGTPENVNGELPQPPIPWRYEYGYPSDCLKVRFVIPQHHSMATSSPIMTGVALNYQPHVKTAMPFVPAIDTDASGNQIKVMLTNAPKALGVYTARINNPDLWDPLLQNAVIAALAAYFVNPLNRNKELLAERTQVAVSLLAQARVADGNEEIMSIDHYPDWLKVRGAGGAFSGGLDGGGELLHAGWDAWSGPDGLSY